MPWRLNPTVGLWAAGVATLATLLGLLSAYDPGLAIFCAVAAVFIAVTMVDLIGGVVLFTLLVGVIEVIPGLGEVSAAKLAAGVLALAWIGAAVTSDTPRRQLVDGFPALAAVSLLLVAWAAASALWAEDSDRAISDTIRLALNMLLVPIVFAAATETRHVRWMIGAFVAGTIVSALYGFAVAPDDLTTIGRLGGAGIDPNYLAIWLVAAAALALAVAADPQVPRPVRFVALLAPVVCIGLLLQTASRTGIVALAAVAVAGVVFAGRGRRLPLVAVLVLSIGGGAMYFGGVAPETARERLTQADDGSGRTSIWQIGWRMAEAEPVHGVGLGNFQVSSIHYLLEPGAILRDEFIVTKPRVAHNVYLELLAELGVIGLVLFLALVALCMVAAALAARIFQRLSDRSGEAIARGTLLAMTAVATGCFFVSIQYTKPIWMLLALGPVLLSRARRAERGHGAA